MNTSDASIQIRSLRVQLDVSEARLRFVPSPTAHTLAELRGVLIADELMTDAELEAAKYQGLDKDMP